MVGERQRCRQREGATTMEAGSWQNSGKIKGNNDKSRMDIASKEAYHRRHVGESIETDSNLRRDWRSKRSGKKTGLKLAARKLRRAEKS
jgi:hypothetical protein